MARRYPRQIYNLLLRSAWKTIASLCGRAENLGAKPGMTAVLHTWGSDLKYHIHAHCLITFGGLTKDLGWRWPRRKHKITPYRKICGKFRAIMLVGLERLMEREAIGYHQSFEELKAVLTKKRWVVHNTHPTADTKVIEEYLGRYICRIGISSKRLHYDKTGKNVRIEYND